MSRSSDVLDDAAKRSQDSPGGSEKLNVIVAYACLGNFVLPYLSGLILAVLAIGAWRKEVTGFRRFVLGNSFFIAFHIWICQGLAYMTLSDSPFLHDLVVLEPLRDSLFLRAYVPIFLLCGTMSLISMISFWRALDGRLRIAAIGMACGAGTLAHGVFIWVSEKGDFSHLWYGWFATMGAGLVIMAGSGLAVVGIRRKATS